MKIKIQALLAHGLLKGGADLFLVILEIGLVAVKDLGHRFKTHGRIELHGGDDVEPGDVGVKVPGDGCGGAEKLRQAVQFVKGNENCPVGHDMSSVKLEGSVLNLT